jgi:hypothetical protein
MGLGVHDEGGGGLRIPVGDLLECGGIEELRG